MYSITNNKRGKYKTPAQNHFLPASLSSATKQLHFSYKLVDLQKEIEKRTFYLGKFRRTEEAQHLLDLIGMSRDENDLLYSFSRAAMADVFDNINSNSLHIPKKYEWKGLTEPVDIRINHETGTDIDEETLDGKVTIIDKNKGIIEVHADFAMNEIVDEYTYEVSAIFRLECNCKRLIKDTLNSSEIAITTDKYIEVEIPPKNIIYKGNDTWTVVGFRCEVPLETQGEYVSSEWVNSVNINNTTGYVLLKDAKKIASGTFFTFKNQTYESIVDTDENEINKNINAVAVLTDSEEAIVEGIHYYFDVPEYLNLTTVDPLDNAIMEALVNRIIWKWLVLSYPQEAATYDTLYQDNIKSIAMRCNIFNKHWQQVPRIL